MIAIALASGFLLGVIYAAWSDGKTFVQMPPVKDVCGCCLKPVETCEKI